MVGMNGSLAYQIAEKLVDDGYCKADRGWDDDKEHFIEHVANEIAPIIVRWFNQNVMGDNL
jgi:hypothetical protein